MHWRRRYLTDLSVVFGHELLHHRAESVLYVTFVAGREEVVLGVARRRRWRWKFCHCGMIGFAGMTGVVW